MYDVQGLRCQLATVHWLDKNELEAESLRFAKLRSWLSSSWNIVSSISSSGS